MDLQLRTCSDVAYNQTAFPTLLDLRSREAVESSSEYILLSVLHHLLEGQCNPDLRLLGCAVLAPRCGGGRVHRPCRHVCEALREACQPAFDAIDMAWPYFLDCGRYFASAEEGCYDPLEKLRGAWGPGGCAGAPRFGWDNRVTVGTDAPPIRSPQMLVPGPDLRCAEELLGQSPGPGPARKGACRLLAGAGLLRAGSGQQGRGCGEPGFRCPRWVSQQGWNGQPWEVMSCSSREVCKEALGGRWRGCCGSEPCVRAGARALYAVCRAPWWGSR